MIEYFIKDYKLVHRDPLDEAAELSSSALLRPRLLRYFMNFVSKLSPIEFSERNNKNGNCNHQHQHSSVRFRYRPFLGQKPAQSSILFKFIIVYYVYVCIKVAVLSVTHWNRAGLIHEWDPKVRLGANKTTLCALVQDIIDDYDPILWDKVKNLNLVLYYLGNHVSSINSLNTMYLISICLPLSVMLIAYLLYSFKGVEFNELALSFNLNPFGMRQKISERTFDIILSILRTKAGCLDEQQFESEQTTMSILPSDNHSDIHQTRKRQSDNQLFYDNYRDCNSDSDDVLELCLSCRLEERETRLDLLELLEISGNLSMLKSPLCFTPTAYKIYIISRFVVFAIWTTGWALILIVVNYYIIRNEIVIRTHYRQLQYQCQLWNPNAMLVRDPTLVNRNDKLEQVWEMELMHEYSTTNGSNWLLVYWNEYFNHLCSPLNFVAYVEFGVLVMLCGLFLAFHWSMVSDSLICKLIWIHQVRNEMIVSKDMLNRMRETKGFHLRLNDEPATLFVEPARRDIYKQLLSTYVNFELLRRHSKYYREFYHLVSFIYMLTGMGLLILVNTAYLRIAGDNSFFVLFIVAAIMIACNVFFIICITLTWNYENLYRLINGIVGESCQVGMQLTYVISLWRRQMMAEKEIQANYATHSFAIPVDRSYLIQLNSYTLGGILYLLLQYSAMGD